MEVQILTTHFAIRDMNSFFSSTSYVSGEIFPGSREDLIDYMASVGYHHFPDGHKVSKKLLHFDFRHCFHFVFCIRRDKFTFLLINRLSRHSAFKM
jgi:hypothetical protein